jgi:hypothetical protein
MKTEIIKRNGYYEVQFTQGVQTFHIPNLEKTKKHAIWQKEMLDKAFENFKIELLASEKEQPVSEQSSAEEWLFKNYNEFTIHCKNTGRSLPFFHKMLEEYAQIRAKVKQL